MLETRPSELGDFQVRESQQGPVDLIFDRNWNYINAEAQFISRTLSNAVNSIDPNLSVRTQALIDDVKKHGRDGNEGDFPFPRGFASSKEFWKLIIMSGINAVILAFAAVAFTNCIDQVPTLWASCDYSGDQTCGNWYNGQKYWIGVTAGAGFLVGLSRYVFSYPDDLPGFFKDIQVKHVDPKWAPLTYLLSALSISGGATLGPEQALGNIGGGLATFVVQNFVSFEEKFYSEIFVLSGIVAPIGALLPNPMLAVTLIIELSENLPLYMESLIILAIPSTIAFAVYYGMIGYTYLSYLSTASISLSEAWIASPGYQGYMLGTGFVIGCVRLALHFMAINIPYSLK